MNKLTKKYIMVGMSLSAALLLAACGNGNTNDTGGTDGAEGEETEELDIGTENAMENFSVGDTFVAEEPLNLEIVYRDLPAYPLNEDWLFFQHLEENHNVTFDITSVPLSDWEDRISVIMGAGDMPDYIGDMWAGHEIPYVPSGQLLPISDYIEYMPHLSQRIEEWDGVAEQMENLRQQDGKYYVLPGLNENILFEFGLMHNKTVFDEHGIEEPQSWDELRAALEILRDERGTAPMTLWGQGNALLNVGAASFGSGAWGWGYMNGVVFDRDTGEYVLTARQDEFKDMVTYFSELTADGLMNVEALTQDDDMTRSLLVSTDAVVT